MASELPSAPVRLIETKPNGKLVVQEEAVEILARIRQPVVVVAIVGLCCTGKSYLLNRLAGRRKGFPLGAMVQVQTTGIWMWCLPHPHKPDHTLVLLDTKGLGDVEKGDTKSDTWIFALSVLLSSTLVFNSMGTIDQFALEQLQYVAELTERIRVKSPSKECQEDDDSAEFVRFFPEFIWTVRDFVLELMLDGRHISEDEYLENALKMRPVGTVRPSKCNLPRLCVRKFFPSRKCFVFDRPTSRRNLLRLETLEDDQLEEGFLETTASFCKHIWETSRPKTVPGGWSITGAMLANLAKNYIQAINSGAVPCLENAVEALAEIENAAAVREAVSHYEEQMRQQLKLPTGTAEELLTAHAQCERDATKVFLSRAFGDNFKQHQAELVQCLQQQKEEFCKKNQRVSSDRCLAVLLGLSRELKDGICKGVYAVPGGYQHFLDKQKEIVEKYHAVPGKGIQAEKVLEEFLKSKETVAKSILHADNALTDKQKETEAERAWIEAAEMEQRLLEKEQARLKQVFEVQQKLHDEQITLLRKKMEEEKEVLQKEYKRMMEHKRQEQKKLAQEGFQKNAEEMESEIRHVKQVRKTSETSATTESAISEIQNLLAPMMPLFFQYKTLSKAARVFKD